RLNRKNHSRIDIRKIMIKETNRENVGQENRNDFWLALRPIFLSYIFLSVFLSVKLVRPAPEYVRPLHRTSRSAATGSEREKLRAENRRSNLDARAHRPFPAAQAPTPLQ